MTYAWQKNSNSSIGTNRSKTICANSSVWPCAKISTANTTGPQSHWSTPDQQGRAAVVVRQAGVLAGLRTMPVVIDEMQAAIDCQLRSADGDEVAAGTVVAELSGSARDLLTCERPILNFLGRLSGIATLTRQYVSRLEGTGARVYDTRKTTPGWRRLEKYAVRCGGGMNHRTGLFDGILIKDNHLALASEQNLSPADAVRRARDFVGSHVRRVATGRRCQPHDH